jgi:hypothetical protein
MKAGEEVAQNGVIFSLNVTMLSARSRGRRGRRTFLSLLVSGRHIPARAVAVAAFQTKWAERAWRCNADSKGEV